jgi:peptide/nickel transport system permease protein
MVIILLIVSFITFVIYYALPSDPVKYICGKPCSPDRYLKAKQFTQMDKPFILQYLDFIKGLFVGRTFGGTLSASSAVICAAPCLGYSFQLQKPVLDLILQRIPVTFSIAIGAAVLWLIIGIVLGIIAARNNGKTLDRVISAFSTFGVSAPAYLIGLIGISVFGIWLKIVPVSSYVEFADNPLEWFHHLILPWVILALLESAIYIRLTKSGYLEAVKSEYYRTAAAKGLGNKTLFWHHIAKNAAIPIVTLFGIGFGSLLSGAVITESVFSMNGLGQLLIQAVKTQDLSQVMGLTLFASFLILAANLIVDLLNTWLNPKSNVSFL